MFVPDGVVVPVPAGDTAKDIWNWSLKLTLSGLLPVLCWNVLEPLANHCSLEEMPIGDATVTILL